MLKTTPTRCKGRSSAVLVSRARPTYMAEELSFGLILHLSKLKTGYEQGCSTSLSPFFLPTFLFERCFGVKNGDCKSQDDEEREHKTVLHFMPPLLPSPPSTHSHLHSPSDATSDGAGKNGGDWARKCRKRT